jgi:signal transduction histidine kinase
MDFTRPTRVEPVPVEPNDLVRRSLSMLTEQAAESGIELRFDLEDHLPLCALDEKLIHQVLLNLVRNAFEALAAMAEPPDHPLVVVSTRRSEDSVELSVRDNGPGLPPDILRDVFEPFISRKVGGTGLGLAVVRKIMLDHGGEIVVESNPGEGATFNVTLPLAGEEG